MGKPANTLISKEIRKRDIKNLIAMLISQIGIQGLCTTLISTYISSFYTDYLCLYWTHQFDARHWYYH